MQVFRSLFFLIASSALSGCGTTNSSASAPVNPLLAAEATLTFVLSGDTAGYLVPCGCTSKQYGGLPRRATYLKSRTVPTLYVDAGGSIARGTPYDALKLQFILRGMALLHPAAVNLGAGELNLNADELGNFATLVPLFSTNVRATPKPLWPDRLVVKAADGTRVGFVGVCLNMAERTGNKLEILDAHAALQQILPALAKESDVLVLLAYGDEQSALKLAANFPELSAVFLAGCGQSITPRKEEFFTLAGVAQKGKFLAHLTLTGSRNAVTLRDGEIVELSESFADDPEQMQNLAAYKQRLKDAPLPPDHTGEAPAQFRNLPAGYAFAGSAACATCHVHAASIHTASRHAQGLNTLHEKKFDFDPSCLKCHVTGYGGPGGFKDALTTPTLGGIGCENCHGPSQAHATKPQIKTPFSDAKAACLDCHDPENSPKFEYATYWKKIEHGRETLK